MPSIYDDSPCFALQTVGNRPMHPLVYSRRLHPEMPTSCAHARHMSSMMRDLMDKIHNYNTRPTQKSPVPQQNAWFDRKKPGSTEKCPVRQKNALPRMHQLTLPLSSIPPPPSSEKYFFPIFFPYFFNNQ